MANIVSRPDLDIFFMSKRSTGLILDSLCLPHMFVVSWRWYDVQKSARFLFLGIKKSFIPSPTM